MDCQKSMENFPDYQGGRLEPEERDAVEAHLKGCKTCCTQLEAFSIVDVELNLWKDLEPSPWLEQRAMARLETKQEEHPQPRHMAWLRPQWAALTALFILTGLGSWLMLHRPERAVEPSHPWGNKTSTRNSSLDQGTGSAAIGIVGKNPKELNHTQDSVLTTTSGKEISQEDWTLLENLDLLENFDLLNPAEPEEIPAPKGSASGSR
jgi:hypothetical protein